MGGGAGDRATTQGSAAAADANALTLIRLKRRLGIAREGALHAVLASRILVDPANSIYLHGDWPSIVLTGGPVSGFSRADYFRLRDARVLRGLVGLVIFSVFPVAPPRPTNLPRVDAMTRDAAGYREVLALRWSTSTRPCRSCTPAGICSPESWSSAPPVTGCRARLQCWCRRR